MLSGNCLIIFLLFSIGICKGYDICEFQEDGTYLSHPADCSKFILCLRNMTTAIESCPLGLHFNRELGICDYKARAGCDRNFRNTIFVERSCCCCASNTNSNCNPDPICPTTESSPCPDEVPSPSPTEPTELSTPSLTEPTKTPTPSPSVPAELSTPSPTEPTEVPTRSPTEPTELPTPSTTEPIDAPTPTDVPTRSPAEPNEVSTSSPTEPTDVPTSSPTEPTEEPTRNPTEPTEVPIPSSTEPTQVPTPSPSEPTKVPTSSPTEPTDVSTRSPFQVPTPSTAEPTEDPTSRSTIPTDVPTPSPTAPTDKSTPSHTEPIEVPTSNPTEPTEVPTRTSTEPTASTTKPTQVPTPSPSEPTEVPTPSATKPTEVPTPTPTEPTVAPTPITITDYYLPLCNNNLTFCLNITGIKNILYPGDCHKYIVCIDGCSTVMNCSANLYYDLVNNICEYPELVDCPFNENKGDLVGPSGRSCDHPGLCAGLPEGAMLPDPDSNGFIICQCECEIKQDCQPGLIFNTQKKTCDWPHRFVTKVTVTECPNGQIYNARAQTCEAVTLVHSDLVTCDSRSVICDNQRDGSLLPVVGICNKFFACVSGCAYEMQCPDNLIFNVTHTFCDYPQYTTCAWPYTPPYGPTAGPSGTACAEGGRCVGQPEGFLLPSHSASDKYVVCQCECEVEMSCPKGLVFNSTEDICDFPKVYQLS